MLLKNASIYWRKISNRKRKNLRKNQNDPDLYFEKMQFFSKAGRSHILNIDADTATGKRRIYAIIQFASHLKKCVNFFDADAATGNGKKRRI